MLARLVLLGVFPLLPLFAQGQQAPVIGPFGVLHGASLQPVAFRLSGSSPAGVAPGSIFILKGAYLGPEEIVAGAAPFGLRLPDAPGGTEVHVRSLETGEVVQARIVHAWAFQVAALLPEDFPRGEAEAQVWYGGRASEPAPFRAVRSYPALFTLSQGGRGIIQNYEGPAELPLNALTRPARPGQTVILWGTGLGAVDRGEVQALIAGFGHPLAYAGPAPGLPGVDQYNLRLPDDLEIFGCYVQLTIESARHSHGQVSIAITPDGEPCEHPWGLTPERMAALEAGARATWIRVNLSDGVSDGDVPQPFGSASGSVATALTQSLNVHGLESATQQSAFFDNLIPQSRRSCGLTNSVGAVFGDFIPGPIEPLPEPPAPENPPLRAADAGQPWFFLGPGGRNFELTPQPDGGFLGPSSFVAGFLTPGDWTLNVPGGADVPAFWSNARMPRMPEVNVPAAIRRDEPLDLTWSTGNLEPNASASVELAVRLPAAGPGQLRQVGLHCAAVLESGRILLEVPDLREQLGGVDSVRLTFRVASRRTPTLPGIDRVDLEGTAFRTWTVPLE